MGHRNGGRCLDSALYELRALRRRHLALEVVPRLAQRVGGGCRIGDGGAGASVLRAFGCVGLRLYRRICLHFLEVLWGFRRSHRCWPLTGRRLGRCELGLCLRRFCSRPQL